MGKKKLLPGQKSPIVRSTTAKPIPGLSETELTTGWDGQAHGLQPAQQCQTLHSYACPPFAGDDAE
uniref:Uncharacterized protein n=1 Tax=Moorena producens (strain JHB) TaxID=1454205 RepID=A0A1D9G435_MOOP1